MVSNSNLFASLVGAIVGGVLTMTGSVVFWNWQKQNEMQSSACLIAGELKSILPFYEAEYVRAQKYPEEAIDAIFSLGVVGV